MAGSVFGNIFKISTWGESHGEGLGNEVGCARIPAYFFGFFSWLFSNMFILFSYYYIDVFGLVRYICLPGHHKTPFFLEKSRRCGKNTVRFIIHKTNYSYKSEIGGSRSTPARLCRSPWLVWAVGLPTIIWHQREFRREMYIASKYGCLFEPKAS